jgi:hypothetical protein
MLERCGYRAALYLSALIAAVNCSALLYSRWYLPHLADSSAIYAVAALTILVGLWLFSKIARYGGAAFYTFSAATAVFALWGFVGPVQVGVIWAITTGVLSLAAALVLVFSRSFAREFVSGRKQRPPYKKYLLGAFTFLIVLVVGVAVLIDVVAFFQLAASNK